MSRAHQSPVQDMSAPLRSGVYSLGLQRPIGFHDSFKAHADRAQTINRRLDRTAHTWRTIRLVRRGLWRELRDNATMQNAFDLADRAIDAVDFVVNNASEWLRGVRD